MSTSADDVLRMALELDPHDRAEIAASLIASLDPQHDDDVDAAWATEIKKRIEEIDAGGPLDPFGRGTAIDARAFEWLS